MIRAAEVQVREVAASVSMIGCWTARIEQVEGDVVLIDTPLESATGLSGLLLQRWYGFGGMRWEDDRPVATRTGEYRCQIDGVDGEVDIEVGRAAIEIRRARGKVRVHNRHGSTCEHVETPLDGQRHQLTSVSGAVRAVLRDKLLPAVRLACVTLCGSISYDAFADAEDKPAANSEHMAVFSTIPARERGSFKNVSSADLLLQTESGDIAVEKAG